MACTLDNYTRWLGGCGSDATAPGTPVAGGPFLVVSNWPENVSGTLTNTAGEEPVPTNTLYRCGLSLAPNNQQRIRVYVWHLNSQGGPRYFSLFGRLSAGTGTVSDRRVDSQVATIYPPVGLCLAKVHLWDQWDPALANVNLSTSETAIWQHSVATGSLIGAVMEFDVDVSSQATLYLRTTVSSLTAAPGPWNQAVADDPGTHVRGYWPFSELTMACGLIDVKAVLGATASLIIEAVENGGPEITKFAKTAADTHGTTRGNRGCYGVDLLYDFTVTNTGSQSYPLFVYGQARKVSDIKKVLPNRSQL